MALTTTADKARPQPNRLAGMSWAHFLNDGAANYLPGVLPAILISMNLSVALAGTIMAALLMGQALQPLVGLLADRVGGRIMVVAGLAGSSLGGALVGFVSGFWSLLAVLALIGIYNSFFHPQALAGIRQLGGKKPGMAMSAFMVGGEVGRGVWPVIELGGSSMGPWLSMDPHFAGSVHPAAVIAMGAQAARAHNPCHAHCLAPARGAGVTAGRVFDAALADDLYHRHLRTASVGPVRRLTHHRRKLHHGHAGRRGDRQRRRWISV